MDKHFHSQTQDEWGQQQHEYTQKGQNYNLKYTHSEPETGETRIYETAGQVVHSWENGLIKLKPTHSLDYQFLQTAPVYFYTEADVAVLGLNYEQFSPSKYETLETLTKLANFFISRLTGENIQFHFLLKDWKQARKENQLLLSNPQNDMQLLAFYEKASAGLAINLYLQAEKMPFNFYLHAKNYQFLGQNKQKVSLNLCPLQERKSELESYLALFLAKNTDFSPL